jgi:hypothetical protein
MQGRMAVMIRYGNVMAAVLGKIRLLTREVLPLGSHQTIHQNFYMSADFYNFNAAQSPCLLGVIRRLLPIRSQNFARNHQS